MYNDAREIIKNVINETKVNKVNDLKEIKKNRNNW